MRILKVLSLLMYLFVLVSCNGSLSSENEEDLTSSWLTTDVSEIPIVESCQNSAEYLSETCENVNLYTEEIAFLDECEWFYFSKETYLRYCDMNLGRAFRHEYLYPDTGDATLGELPGGEFWATIFDRCTKQKLSEFTLGDLDFCMEEFFPNLKECE